MSVSYMPHNVQVAPDGKSVWVTGNVASGMEMGMSPIQRLKNIMAEIVPFKKVSAHSDDEMSGGSSMTSDSGAASDRNMASGQDEAIVIDPETDKIIKRIPLGEKLHLAHAVVSPDGKFAYITAQDADKIFKINAHTFEVEDTFTAKKGSAPHGLRLSVNGMTVYVAMSKGNSIGVLDVDSEKISYIPIKGSAVQIAVTPDGKYVTATIFDKKKPGNL